MYLMKIVSLYFQNDIMLDFECHYREERFDTNQYFDFIKDLLRAAQNKEDAHDCDVPPCPTSPYPPLIDEYSEGEYSI